MADSPSSANSVAEPSEEEVRRPPSASGVRAQRDRLPPPARVPSDATGLPRAESVEVEVPFDLARRSSLPSTPPVVARFGRFQLLGRIAVGGMAEIFLAQEPIDGGTMRRVVLKLLRSHLTEDTDFDQMFLREGRVAMQLSHPNICHVYEFGKWGGHFFIAMEWVDGVSLKGLVTRLALHGRRIDPPFAASIIASVAGALDYAHRAKDARRRPLEVVHRDVSPHNVMLSFDGAVKLLDFGVAQVKQAEDESRSDSIKGKFAYMSPEQCLVRPMDGRSDIFALGICLYEALTAKRLYRRDSQYDTFRAIIEDPVPSIRDVVPDLPETLDAIVQKALAKKPSERFQTAGEMQQALLEHLAEHRQVVNATRLRLMLEEYFPTESQTGPELTTGPEVLRRLAPVSDHPPLRASEHPAALVSAAGAERGERISQTETGSAALPVQRSVTPFILVALLAIVGAGAVVWMLRAPPDAAVAPTPPEGTPSSPTTATSDDAIAAEAVGARDIGAGAVEAGPGAASTEAASTEAASTEANSTEGVGPEAIGAELEDDGREGESAQDEDDRVDEARRRDREERRRARREARDRDPSTMERPGFVADPGF